jgi:hypothetical protein
MRTGPALLVLFLVSFEIEKTGFKKLIKPDVPLYVQDALEIDFELTLGEVSESVTVEAAQ